MITLMVTVGQAPKCRTIPVNFVVVKQQSSYNVFLGRPALNALRTIPSTLHLSVKFPTPGGIAEVHGDPEVARAFYLATLRWPEKVVVQTTCLEPYIPGDETQQVSTQDEIEEFPLREERPDQVLRIGALLPAEEKEGLKALLRETAPDLGETLFLYLSACNEAVSAVLVREDGGAQRPVYYVSRALQGPETRYTPAEKLVPALVHAARKLRPYFQAHSIAVLTDQPLRQILTKPEVSGRMIKWAVELAEHDISYQPRTTIKAQALADFLADGAGLTLTELDSPSKDVRPKKPWVLFVDGASSKEGSGAGLLLISPTGEELTYALRLDFPASNNEAEYEALLAGLRIAHQMGISAIQVRSDSQLVVLQVLGEYEAKEEVMKKYLAKVREAVALFDTFQIERVPRSQNKRADALSKLASSSFAHLSKEVLVEVVKQKSIHQVQVLAIDSSATWMAPLIDFLSSGALPENKTEARRIQLRTAKYAYAGRTLYRRSYLSPWLKCVTPDEGNYVLREVHEGICAAHVGSRVLAKKCLLLGYYWPSVFRDAAELVQKCRACQVHASLRHQPAREMIPIHSPWPFA
nr:uncharacterized protein LOC113739086 [Coffea arabica]